MWVTEPIRVDSPFDRGVCIDFTVPDSVIICGVVANHDGVLLLISCPQLRDVTRS